MFKARYTILVPAVIVVMCAGGAPAQTYPNKPIRIVTSGIGTSPDFGSRQIAQGLAENLGQQVVVDNRNNIAAEIVSRAPPDGYTLLVDGSSVWFAPLFQKMPYDPLADFSPISLIAASPNVLVMYPSLPVKSVKELIALAKAKPGQLNYASGNTGSSTHLAAELFKAMAGVDIVRVVHTNAGMRDADLIGGRVQVWFANAAGAAPHVQSGKMRAVAVGSAQPSALFPTLPTLAASGLPGYQAGSFDSMSAPAKTPAAVVNRLNHEVVRVLSQSEVKDRFLKIGVETVGSSPADLATAVKSDTAKWSKLVKDLGIKIE